MWQWTTATAAPLGASARRSQNRGDRGDPSCDGQPSGESLGIGKDQRCRDHAHERAYPNQRIYEAAPPARVP